MNGRYGKWVRPRGAHVANHPIGIVLGIPCEIPHEAGNVRRTMVAAKDLREEVLVRTSHFRMTVQQLREPGGAR